MSNDDPAYASAAIPSGIEGKTFLPDPVTDQLSRVALELGAALWTERRRTRTLERLLVDAGVIAADAMEQWQDCDADAEAGRAELEQWMRRVYGSLTQMGTTDDRKQEGA